MDCSRLIFTFTLLLGDRLLEEQTYKLHKECFFLFSLKDGIKWTVYTRLIFTFTCSLGDRLLDGQTFSLHKECTRWHKMDSLHSLHLPSSFSRVQFAMYLSHSYSLNFYHSLSDQQLCITPGSCIP